MTAANTIRVVAWTAGLLAGAGTFGMAWATQPVEIPFWAVLVLTFVPTRDLVEAVRRILDAVATRVAGEQRPDE